MWGLHAGEGPAQLMHHVDAGATLLAAATKHGLFKPLYAFMVVTLPWDCIAGW